MDHVDSMLVQHHFSKAATKCRYHDNTHVSDEACQTLANLCVLTQYDLSSVACEAFHDVMRDRASVNNLGMHKQMPWLAYTREAACRSATDLPYVKILRCRWRCRSELKKDTIS